MTVDTFGNRMKSYESKEAYSNEKYLYVRLDGNKFSKLTKKLDRPFDRRMTTAMINTTKYLAEKFNAKLAYTQSDEISLVFEPNLNIFNMRKEKLLSLFAGYASAQLNKEIIYFVDNVAAFDCRICEMPNDSEAINAIIWRHLDARKNAISSIAHKVFGPKVLQGINTQDRVLMLEKNDVYLNNFPCENLYGTLFQRKTIEKYLTMYELNRLPNHIRETLYNIPVKRTVYKKYTQLLTFALLKELLHED